MLQPAGPHAASVAAIWWVMFWGGMAIWFFTVGLAVFAALRRRGTSRPVSGRLFILGGGVLFPLAAMLGLHLWGIHVGHALLPTGSDEDVFRVEVRGHQWWWEVIYPKIDGAVLHAANEIHIPAGRPVEIYVGSADVIHSFWVPRLGGKIDAIPGRINRIRLQADLPGVYRGQCAEFCGAQHARMALLVVAHEEEALEQRLALLAHPPPSAARAGRMEFDRHCAHCHSLDAWQPSAQPGPNLADLPHRRWIGAGVLPNNAAARRLWIGNHQDLKPGNLMPSHDALDEAAAEAIAAFLEQTL